MSPEDIDESSECFQQAWRFFARQSARGEVLRLPEVDIASSNVPWVMLNAAFPPGPVNTEAELLRAATAAARYFQPRRLGWTLALCEPRVAPAVRARAAALLAPLGLAPSVVSTGMVAERLLPPSRPPPRLEMRATREARVRADLADINALSYDVAPATGRQVFDLPAFFSSEHRGFVGYRHEQAATCASVLRLGGVAYVSMVATHPAHRFLGCAEAVIRHGLAEARRDWGLERTVLHATPTGLPVYRRMGYRPVTRFQFYLAPGESIS